MEVVAKVIKIEENQVLKMDLGEVSIQIPITEDKPNEVKKAFNCLIEKLKHEEIEIQLENNNGSLYCLICEEYIKQLNTEMKTIRKELEDFDMVVTDNKNDFCE